MQTEDHLSQVVQNIVNQVTTQVNIQVAATIDQKITDLVGQIDIAAIVKEQLSNKLDLKVNQLPIDKASIERELLARIETTSTTVIQNVQATSMVAVNDIVKARVNQIDFDSIMTASLTKAMLDQQLTFPDGSITAGAIDTTGLILSGDQIYGGIIKNFGSVGIDDKASQCQLTILDEAIVVENNLLTNDLTVKGTARLEGDVVITGRVPNDSPFFVNLVNAVAADVRTGIDQTTFQGYSNLIFTRIRESGIDLNVVTVNGQEVITGNSLGLGIVNSNLQTVGMLKELQTSGETYLSQTLYTTNKRVGVNTIEPEHTFTLWDQEVEVAIGKATTNTAFIKTPRNQSLIIGANGNTNLVINPDGSVAVQSLQIGSVTLGSSATPPGDNRQIGTIVFNSNPTIGGPLGWVSLGGARWANFGFID